MSAVLAASACGSGLPNVKLTACEPGAPIQWAITANGSAFSKAEDLVDPAASPLIGKMRVGQVIELQVGQASAREECVARSPASVTWASTAPQVASLVAKDSRTGALTGLGAGDTTVFATVDGVRADLQFLCCQPSCVSPPPLPACQYVPIAAVRVVP